MLSSELKDTEARVKSFANNTTPVLLKALEHGDYFTCMLTISIYISFAVRCAICHRIPS